MTRPAIVIHKAEAYRCCWCKALSPLPQVCPSCLRIALDPVGPRWWVQEGPFDIKEEAETYASRWHSLG